MKYDELVVKYWPEFGVHGKEKVTVEMLLSHQVGHYSFHVNHHGEFEQILILLSL